MSTMNEIKAFYIGELTQIREARETTTFDGLVTSLGEAANKIFDGIEIHLVVKIEGREI